jgi:hypothetical protein
MLGGRPLRAACAICVVAAAAASPVARAKPVSFQDGTTVVLEHGPHASELQVFTAPHFRASLGGGFLDVRPEYEDGHAHHVAAGAAPELQVGYLRLNVLLERWNLPGAQANIFAWGGLGLADAGERAAPHLAPNGGLQLDYETRRFYSALKTDWHAGFDFTHGSSVLQLGLAPYLHDYTGVAAWVIAQGHIMQGSVHDAAGGALLVRLFWRWLWVEAGADDEGEPLGLVMVNF